MARQFNFLSNRHLLKPLLPLCLLLSAWWCLAVPNNALMLQLAQHRYGDHAVKTVNAWQDMITGSQSMASIDKLNAVNIFFNQRIQFNTDLRVWNKADYWATPLETMGRGQGDCEDFSIAKYISLLMAGVPRDQLRIVYVKARIGSPSKNITQAHMVVAFYPSPNADPLILDNLNPQILPASQRRDLLPVFSFNSAGLWVQGQSKPVGSAQKRLSRWRDLLTRLQAEGL